MWAKALYFVHNSCEGKLLTNTQSKNAAKELGYIKVKNVVSNGQAVYFNPKAARDMRYISADIDSHSGGVRKAASSISNLANKHTRYGTFNWDLSERIGDRLGVIKQKRYDFRISKYNRLVLSVEQLKAEWTSVSDVGKPYKGKTLTYAEYLQEENKYLAVVDEILQTLNIHQMKILDLEDHRGLCPHHNKKAMNGSKEILAVVRDVLREQYWCRLYAKDLSIHFGYDYYMYISSKLDRDWIGNIVSKKGLYVEQITRSPYAKRHPIMFWKTY